MRAEEEERWDEAELAKIEDEEHLAKERVECERIEREQREKEEHEQETAEKRQLEEEKEKEAARAKEKGKGRAQTQDKSMAGSSRAVSEGSSRKQVQEDEEDEDEDEEEPLVVKKPRVRKGPTITIRPVMGGERKCQRCHEFGIDCVVAAPKDNKQTRSCGPCYEHKKKCQPMKKELNQLLIDINESTMKALIGTIDNLVGIADLMYFCCVKTLDLVDKYILWKMG